MVKRFTETTKWKDPWYRKLSVEGKLFWNYLCDSCDNAGIWKVDFDLATFQIGVKVDSSIIEQLNNGKERVKLLCDGELLILHEFIPFQIGNLYDKKGLTNLQKSSLNLIHKYTQNKNIEKKVFGYLTRKVPVRYGYLTGIGIGKGNSSSKDFKKSIPNKSNIPSKKKRYSDFVELTEVEYNKLITSYDMSTINDYINKLNVYIGSKGRKYKSHYYTILSWLNKNNVKKKESIDYSKLI